MGDIDNSLESAINALAKETGVAKADIEKILIRLGLEKSMNDLRSTLGVSTPTTFAVNDLVVGVKAAQTLHHR